MNACCALWWWTQFMCKCTTIIECMAVMRRPHTMQLSPPSRPSDAPRSPSQLTHVCYCSNRQLTFDQGWVSPSCVRVHMCSENSARIPAFTALLFCKVRTWPRVFCLDAKQKKKRKKTEKESGGRQTNVEDKAEIQTLRKPQDTKVMQIEIGSKETL